MSSLPPLVGIGILAEILEGIGESLRAEFAFGAGPLKIFLSGGVFERGSIDF